MDRLGQVIFKVAPPDKGEPSDLLLLGELLQVVLEAGPV